MAPAFGIVLLLLSAIQQDVSAAAQVGEHAPTQGSAQTGVLAPRGATRTPDAPVPPAQPRAAQKQPPVQLERGGGKIFRLPRFVHLGAGAACVLWAMLAVQRLVQRWTTGIKLGGASGRRDPPQAMAARPAPTAAPEAGSSGSGGTPARATSSGRRQAQAGPLLRRLPTRCGDEPHDSSGGTNDDRGEHEPVSGTRRTARAAFLDGVLARVRPAPAAPAPGAAAGAQPRPPRPAPPPHPRTARQAFLRSLAPAPAPEAARPAAGAHWASAFARGGLDAALERWRVLDPGVLLVVLEGTDSRSLTLLRSVLPRLAEVLLGAGCEGGGAEHAPAAAAAQAERGPGVSAVRLDEGSEDALFVRDEYAVQSPALLLVWGERAAERLLLHSAHSAPSAAVRALRDALRAAQGVPGGPARGCEALRAAWALFRARPPPSPQEGAQEREARVRAERLALIAEQDAALAAALAHDQAVAAGDGGVDVLAGAPGGPGTDARRAAAPAGASAARGARAGQTDDTAAAPPPSWWADRRAAAAARAAALPAEPGAAEEGAVRLTVRLSTGRRIARAWLPSTPVHSVFEWVESACECEEDAPQAYDLVSSFPRVVVRRPLWQRAPVGAPGARRVLPSASPGQGADSATLAELLPFVRTDKSASLHVEEDEQQSDEDE